MAEAGTIRTRSGVELFVRDWGSGAPVLLLAGWGMASELWGAVMLRLNDAGLRTIAYDRRGHGRSSDPGVVTYDALADDLADVIGTLGLRDLTVVAHSGAGGEVLRYATRHGAARLSRIVFVGATLPALRLTDANPDGIDGAALDAVSQRLAEDLPGWIEDNARPFVLPDTAGRVIDWLAAMVMGCSHRILVDYQREIARTDFRDELAALRVPVTIIQGDQDVSAPPAVCGRRIAALRPDADYRVYEGVSHGPMVTHAARLAEDIARAARASSRPA